MKKGNATLYIIIGVVALAVIGFLVMQNRENAVMTDTEDAMMTDETTVSEDGAMVEESDSMMENEGVLVGGAMMTPDRDIVDNAVESADHTTLVAAVQAAGLVETLKGDGPFTVFAPTNAAFDKLPEGAVEELVMPENNGELTSILTYHVVSGKYTSDMITEGLQLETVNGEMLTFNEVDGQWWINNSAMITIADVMSSNGVTHVIDTVLMP